MTMDNEGTSATCKIISVPFYKAYAPVNDCWLCRQEQHCKCIDWREIKIQKLILPNDEVLKSPIFYSGLAMASKSTGKSRREFISYMTSILYRDMYKFYASDGVTEFKLKLCSVYEAFNNDEDFRWVSDFMETTFESRKIKASDNLLPRLKLITFTFMIVDIALIRNLENEYLEDVRKKKSLKVQMIWCASFENGNRRYDLEVMNNGEAEVIIFENYSFKNRIRLQLAPDKWDLDIAKSLNILK